MPLIENIYIGTKVHISLNLTKQISIDCSADPHLGVKPICIVCYLPRMYPTLIISVLYLYGTKMFPQFE